MYETLNIWIWYCVIGFGLVSLLIICGGYLADKRNKRKQKDFWKQVALDDLERRPDG